VTFDFGPASMDKQIVFGAQRPSYSWKSVSPSDIQEWIFFMKKQGIKRVCCLLPQDQMKYYQVNLLDIYRKEFGPANVC